MSVPRVFSQGRLALSRGFATRAPRATGSILRTVGTTLSQRQFSSNVRLQQETIQTPANGAEVPLTATRKASPEINARSIAITKLPKRVVKADIEKFLSSVGIDAKRIQLRVDRFTFFSDSSCFIELSSREQVIQAVQKLDDKLLKGSSVVVRPLNKDFYWDQGFKKDKAFFFLDENTPSQAIQPLLQGRRIVLQVEGSGWQSQEGSGKSVNVTRREIIEKHIGPFGIEVIGSLNPIWRQKGRDRTFLANIDFASKEGAEQAIKAFHGKEVEGKRVYLIPSTLNSTRAKQMGDVDQGVLEQVRDRGLIEDSESLTAIA